MTKLEQLILESLQSIIPATEVSADVIPCRSAPSGELRDFLFVNTAVSSEILANPTHELVMNMRQCAALIVNTALFSSGRVAPVDGIVIRIILPDGSTQGRRVYWTTINVTAVATVGRQLAREDIPPLSGGEFSVIDAISAHLS